MDPAHRADAVRTGWPFRRLDRRAVRHAPTAPNSRCEWTHILTDALSAGPAIGARPGWCRARSAEFSRPLMAVTGGPGGFRGLPANGSLLQVGPGRRGAIGALKRGPSRKPARTWQGLIPLTTAKWPLRLVELAAVTPTSSCASRWVGVRAESADCWSGRVRSRSRQLTACRIHRSALRWRDSTCPGAARRDTAWRHRPRNAPQRCTRGTGCTTADRPPMGGLPAGRPHHPHGSRGQRAPT